MTLDFGRFVLALRQEGNVYSRDRERHLPSVRRAMSIFVCRRTNKAASIPENTWPSYGVRDARVLHVYRHCTPTGCAMRGCFVSPNIAPLPGWSHRRCKPTCRILVNLLFTLRLIISAALKPRLTHDFRAQGHQVTVALVLAAHRSAARR